jgi:hypothetical protein
MEKTSQLWKMPDEEIGFNLTINKDRAFPYYRIILGIKPPAFGWRQHRYPAPNFRQQARRYENPLPLARMKQ